MTLKRDDLDKVVIKKKGDIIEFVEINGVPIRRVLNYSISKYPYENTVIDISITADVTLVDE